MDELTLQPGQLSLTQLQRIAQGTTQLKLAKNFHGVMEKSLNYINREVLERQQPIYGVNTGFGALANIPIDPKELDALQRRLILSHATGVGPCLSAALVRLTMALKINSLLRGYSGVRPLLVQRLVDLFNAGIYPRIPAKGSVGACGDLAPLAHMSAALLGLGDVNYQGQIMPASDALAAINLQPMTLAPKEGLALLNGTQVSVAQLLQALFQAQRNFSAVLVTGSLSLEAALGSANAFDPRVQQVCQQPGQQQVAAVFRKLLQDSEIRTSLQAQKRVQDPYSLRCQPQVMGACWGQIDHVVKTVSAQANAVTDNPLVFADEAILSGGNFHGQALAMAADNLALALAEMGTLAERRIALLMDPNFSHLPPFLVQDAGLNSGFMMAHVTAAALTSENRFYSHAASTDSIPTSVNQEDHVSMSTFATRRLQEMNDNLGHIIAIEYLAASQGVELQAPLKTSPLLQEVIAQLREQVPHYQDDRFFAPDLTLAKQIIDDGFFMRYMPTDL